MKNNGFAKDRRSHTILTVVFAIIAIAYLYPIFIVLVNSLKTNASINLDTFAFPTKDSLFGRATVSVFTWALSLKEFIRTRIIGMR